MLGLRKIIFAIFCFLYFCIPPVPAARDQVYFKLTNIRCECPDPKDCHFTQCRLKARSRTETAVYINMTLGHQPPNTIMMNFDVYRRATITFQPFPINITLGICQFLGNMYKFPVLRYTYQHAMSFTNLNHSCPIKEKYIAVQNFAPAIHGFYGFIPEGAYLFKLKMMLPSGKVVTSMEFKSEYINPKNTFLS